MSPYRTVQPGIDFFWLQADEDESAENPLERELGHRLDVLARYHRLIIDAQASGREDIVDALLPQHDRQAQLCRELRSALDRVQPRMEALSNPSQ